MEYYDVFKGPFKADEECCYIWCNDGTQVCFDVMDGRDAKLGQRIADCLNDAPGHKHFKDIGISDDGQYICDGHSPLLCVRGWGYLTGTGGLNLSGEEARRIQDEFVKWAAAQLGFLGMTTVQMQEENIEYLRKQIKTYSDLLVHLRDNIGIETYDMLDNLTYNSDMQSKGYVEGVSDMHNGKPVIRFEMDGVKHVAEWYEDWKHGVCQYTDCCEDSYYGYLLLPQIEDLNENPRTEINRYLCIYYTC